MEGFWGGVVVGALVVFACLIAQVKFNERIREAREEGYAKAKAEFAKDKKEDETPPKVAPVPAKSGFGNWSAT